MEKSIYTLYSAGPLEVVQTYMSKIEDVFKKHGYVTVYDVCRILNFPRSFGNSYAVGWDHIDDIYPYRTCFRSEGTWSLNFPDPKPLIEFEKEDPEPALKMSPDRFKELLDELDGNSLQTLKEKNARYAQNGDCLHNFRSGAEIVGGTPAQACWGYLTKHLVALRDMVDKNDFSNREDFLEKCQDTINYIRFLWCIGNDDAKEVKEVKEESIYKACSEVLKDAKDPNSILVVNRILENMRKGE